VQARYVANHFNTTVHAVDYSSSMTEANRRINQLCRMEDKVLTLDCDAIAIDLEGRGILGRCDYVYSLWTMLFITDKTALF